jgi:hypothetical protein
MLEPARRLLAAAVISVSLAGALGACGGGGPKAQTPAQPPATSIDRNAGGVVGTPVNRARNVVGQLNQHESELERRTGG